MKFEQDILKAQIASQLSQEASIEGTDVNILIKSFEDNLIGSYDRDMFMKSWSGDLQKKFPNGGFKTINGAAVFINGGKVVAGLGGFNGMIDDYFSAKKESDSKPKVEGSSKIDNTIKIMNSLVKNNGMPLKELYDKTIEGHGIRDGALIFSEFIKRKKDEGDKKIMDEFNKTSFTENVNPSKPKEEEKKDDKPKKEEKAKLSPRAKQVLKDSQRTFDSSNSLRQIELYDLVKKNIGIDKNGKEKIGMGLDEDMVAAGNEFLKKNEKAYNEAKDLIQSRKDFKKEEGKQKAIKDVSNIENIALQQNKEMEDKIKNVSSSASVKEKLEGVKQISNKIDNISKQEIYNSKTNQYNFKLMEDMSDVLKNIDEKYLSKDQKNEIDELKDNLDTMVSVDTLLSAPDQSKKKRRYEYDHFLKEHDSLSDKMEALTKRLKYESDDKGNYSPQEHGSLSSFEDEVENVQKFLESIKKDYTSKRATELLNYKLF